MFYKKNILAAALLTLFVPLMVSAEGESATGSPLDLLKPEFFFGALKRNITVPLAAEGVENVKIPSPEETLKETSPALKRINERVKEEVGVDLSKFIGWFAKILKGFFQIIINVLEVVSSASRS